MTTSLQIQQAFIIDGRTFETKDAALAYIRIPKVTEALNAVTEGNGELNDWLLNNEAAIKTVFEKGTVRRVTTKEKAALVEALGAVESGFLKEHADAIVASFKWPAVKKITPEEHAAAAAEALTELLEGNEKLVSWIISNETAILAAYEAGVEKRQVSEKATQGLAAYQARVAEQLVIHATSIGQLDVLEAIQADVASKGIQPADAAKALGHEVFWKEANVAAKAAAKIVKPAV